MSTDDAPHGQPGRNGGHRPGAGRPPTRDPAARAAYDAAQAARRAAEGRPAKPKPGSGGYRPNGGRRKGDGARANETALELARRHTQEMATMTARHRRELRAFTTREKLAAASAIIKAGA